jgi:outer membrane protein assembly factor BamB
MKKSIVLLALGALCAATLHADNPAFDWPQFRGPNRDDVSKETGLLKEWPPGGPKKLWSFDKAGLGYSGFSVAAGRLYTLGIRDGQQTLLCLDAATGKEGWATPFGPDAKGYNTGWGEGPRSTPTVDGDHIYALGPTGDLVCAAARDGKITWQKNMKDFGGKTFGWGYAESPLIDGPKLVCTPGGSQGTVAALDKKTGAVLWQSKELTDGAQYASLVPATINGTPQYVLLTMQSLAGIAAKDGKVLWRVDWPGATAVIPTPIIRGNQVFATSGYKVGCRAITIAPDGTTNEIYRNNDLENHHGGVVLVGDYLYGHSTKAGWTCLDWKTGAVKWQEKAKLGKGCITSAGGMLYLLDEKTGDCVLLEPNPNGWAEKGRFKLEPQSPNRNPKGGIWTHPVVSNGRLYLRDQELIHCYAVK